MCLICLGPNSANNFVHKCSGFNRVEGDTVQLSFLHNQDLTLFLYNHNIVEKYFRKQENVGVKLLKGARRLSYL